MIERDPRTKWQGEDVAASYRTTRFRSARAAGRDGRLVERLLARFAGGRRFASVLDAPCGTGRLAPTLAAHAARYVGADVSPAMLRARAGDAPAPPPGPADPAVGARCVSLTVAADAARLPFADGAFELVVCCRLLHHLDDDGVGRVARELVRVGSDLVLASFWDAGSVQGWRRRAGLRVDPEGRRPTTRARIRAAFEGAGAEVLGFDGSLRYWSMQTFALARVGGGRP